jgi:hypothetical protein
MRSGPGKRANRTSEIRAKSRRGVVVGEGAAPSRHANLAFTGVYKTPLHGWCYPPLGRVV